MAPTFHAPNILILTLPTVAVILLGVVWYRRNSKPPANDKLDPGGGGGGSSGRKRYKHQPVPSPAPLVDDPPVSPKGVVKQAYKQTKVETKIEVEAKVTPKIEVTKVETKHEEKVMPKIEVPKVETKEVPKETAKAEFEEAMQQAMHKAVRELETAAPIAEISGETEVGDKMEAVRIKIAEVDLMESTSAAYVEECVVSPNVESTNTTHSDLMTDEGITADDPMSVEPEDAPQLAVMPLSVEIPAEPNQNERINDWVKEIMEEASLRNESFASIQSDGIVDMNKSLLKTQASKPVEEPKRVKTAETPSTIASPSKPSASQRQSRSLQKSLPPPKKQASVTSPSASIETSAKPTRVRSAQPSAAESQPESKSKKRRSRQQLVKRNRSLMNVETRTPQTTSGAEAGRKEEPFESFKKPEKEQRLYDRPGDGVNSSFKKGDKADQKIIKQKQQECDEDRDSANHSPVELDSQSVHFSDVHSEGSTDSGKGCSEGAASPSPRTPAGGSVAGDPNTIIIFQFVVPQEHVGKLIGKRGQFINSIKNASNTKVYIKKHPYTFTSKLCALEGSQLEIAAALEIIRSRFPEEYYPDITLDEFPAFTVPVECPLNPSIARLELVEGVNNDVVISAVVNAGHFFLQQPMHPTRQSLEQLNVLMNQAYSCPEAPGVPKATTNIVVAAPAMGGWYRAQIVSVDENADLCDVKFLDYGGYLTLSTSCLKAVRSDFLLLPFQAVEVFLANIVPVNDTWSEEAKLVVEGLTYGNMLQAQVYDYAEDGSPLVVLFAFQGSQAINVNQELVARGLAYSVLPNESSVPDDFYVYT